MRPAQAILSLFALRSVVSRVFVATVTAAAVAVGAWVNLAPASPDVRHLTETFPVGSIRVKVERFEPKSGGRHPAVVLLHGVDGLWQMGDIYRASATRLADKGFVVLLPHYFDRTGTQPTDVPLLLSDFRGYLEDTKDSSDKWQKVHVPFEAWLEVVRAGVTHARGLDSVSEGRVGLVGISLGGYLALTAGTDDRLGVGAVVDHFGGMPRCVRSTVRAMPPTLLVHGDRDTTVPIREAYLVRDALLGRKLACELKVYEGIGHVFMDEDGSISWNGARALFDAEERTATFLNRHLRSEESD
jgi:dienelactone hydrolase